jgi:cellulose synthase/poly-beta-1,6-N-acetylglucosamine synthase-like glycosyltransferase
MTWWEVVLAAIVFYNGLVVVYFFAINTQYLALMLVGFAKTRKTLRAWRWGDLRWLLQSPLTPPISVIAPAYNEQANIVHSVRSLLMLHYPKFEVVVVNDGSTDATLKILIEEFGLRVVTRRVDVVVPCRPIRAVYESREYPTLVVIDKENGGGKADALNAGLSVALYPLFCALDADSVLEEEALLRVVRPFVEEPGLTVASGGVIRIVNGSEVRAGRLVRVQIPREPLVLIQIVEYLRAFFFGRMGWEACNGLLIISGAFGVFDKQTVLSVGGYAPDTLGEDIELVVRLHRRLRDERRHYRIRFVPDAICWTEAPTTLRVLRGQRNRWQRGLIDTLWRHRAMLGRPRYGVIGLASMPCFLLFEMLGPLVELTGYIMVPFCFLLGLVDPRFFAAFLGVVVLYGTLVSITAVLLEDTTFRRHPHLWHLIVLALAGFIENLGYRQINTWWRTLAFLDYRRGNQAWGDMERRGVGKA